MKTKLIVIWVGVFLLVGMCLYPPWISKRHHELKSEPIKKQEEMIKRVRAEFKEKIKSINKIASPHYREREMKRELDRRRFGLSRPEYLIKYFKDLQRSKLSRRPSEIRQYSSLFSPPTIAGVNHSSITIDYTSELDLPRLGLHLIMGIVLIGGILFTLSVLGKKKESNKE